MEYRFLDVPAEELETPFALPKPQSGGESIVFNFTKVISLSKDKHPARRKRLQKVMRTSEVTAEAAATSTSKESLNQPVAPDHVLVFMLVSEPPDDKPDLDCEDVGVAKLDLKSILDTGEDFIENFVDVYSTEAQSKVSRLLNTGNKPIGTLQVTVKAIEAFKALKVIPT